MRKFVLLLFVVACLFAFAGSSFGLTLACDTRVKLSDKYAGFPPPVPAQAKSLTDTFYASVWSDCGPVTTGEVCFYNTSHRDYLLKCVKVVNGAATLSNAKLDSTDNIEYVYAVFDGPGYCDSTSKAVPIYNNWWK